MLNRRLFLGSAAALGLAAAAPPRLLADTRKILEAGSRVLEVKGKPAKAYGLSQADGRQLLAFKKGDRFAVRLVNRLAEPTLVHWHGLTPPSTQDGVPGLSQAPLAPGASYDYDFPLLRSGTYWMHSHVGLQEQQLLAAPLIIRDPAEASLDEQEVVLMLHDFTFRDPDELLAELTAGKSAPMGSGDAATKGTMSMGDHGMAMSGMGRANGQTGMAAGASAGTEMPDLNDVDFDAYLANDRTLDDPDVVRVEGGGRVRLRIINAAAATNFWIDIGRLTGTLIAVDGQAVEPLSAARLELAMAQRLDLRLQLPKGAGAYPILAVREGDAAWTGIVLATPNAAVQRISGQAPEKAGPVGLDLEQRLRSTTPLTPRPADRVLALDLTGDMASYIWTLNGARYEDRTPLRVARGQRVAVVMRNRTMMSHPMHLHGHHFQVVEINGTRLAGAIRDTVLVPAQGAVTVAFDADNPGRWAFHCHNLYHMAVGMMTSLDYITPS